MIKKPIINYIESNLVFPIISLIDKPVQELKKNLFSF